jgi:hypothetical protein
MVSDVGKGSALEQGLFMATHVDTTSNSAVYSELTMSKHAFFGALRRAPHDLDLNLSNGQVEMIASTCVYRISIRGGGLSLALKVPIINMM